MYLELEVHWWLDLIGPYPFLASGAEQTVPGWSLWLAVIFPDTLGLWEHLFPVFFTSNFQLYFAVVDGRILVIQNEKIIQGILRNEVHPAWSCANLKYPKLAQH